MASDTDAPVDLYIAAYTRPGRSPRRLGRHQAARRRRRDQGRRARSSSAAASDGKIHVDDDFHTAAKGAAWGAVGGAVVGLIFPPTLLVGALVGAGVGAGAGGLLSHGEKEAIKAEVEDTLPLNSSGIVAMFEEQWAGRDRQGAPQRQQGHEGAGRRRTAQTEVKTAATKTGPQEGRSPALVVDSAKSQPEP